LTETLKVHPRIKHYIQLKIISFIRIHTSLNIADIMTKNSDTKQFPFLRDQSLGVIIVFNYLNKIDYQFRICFYFKYEIKFLLFIILK
jgi:hypothetical protein